MHNNVSSATAYSVAFLRAIHQLSDRPLVFDDPLAVPLVGGAPVLIQSNVWHRASTPGMMSVRAYIAARSRFAEEELATAVDRGASQYVILGAGFDTFAYRNPYAERLTVFEVDSPAAQAEKRYRLTITGVQVPSTVRFVPTNLERGGLLATLRECGFLENRVTFVSWMGVSYYLPKHVFWQVLDGIASMREESRFVLDLFVPVETLPHSEQVIYRGAAQHVASLGEPYQYHPDPGEFLNRVLSIGLRVETMLASIEINRRYFADRPDQLAVNSALVRLVSGSVIRKRIADL